MQSTSCILSTGCIPLRSHLGKGKSAKSRQFCSSIVSGRPYLVVLPRKQRISLIGQDLSQHTSLVSRKLSALLEDIVGREGHDTPPDVVVMLDRSAVNIFCDRQFNAIGNNIFSSVDTFEPRPTDSTRTHWARFGIGVDGKLSPSSENLSRGHVSCNKNSRASIDC